MIGTVHAENGKANAAALNSILNALNPDVIFAEIPPAKILSYINGSHGNLESAAVSQYLGNRSVAVVPVDLEEPSEDFFRESEEMFNKVERTSSVYRRLLVQHCSDTTNNGFSYLNSDRCEQAWVKIYQETLETVEWIGVPSLRKVYANWTEMNELRERSMVEKIKTYYSGNTPSHGVLLVGAAHKNALMKKFKVAIGR